MRIIYMGGSGTEEKLRQIAAGLVKAVADRWTVMTGDFEKLHGRKIVEKDVIHSGAGVEAFDGLIEIVISEMLDDKTDKASLVSLLYAIILRATAANNDGVALYFKDKPIVTWKFDSDQLKVVGVMA